MEKETSSKKNVLQIILQAIAATIGAILGSGTI